MGKFIEETLKQVIDGVRAAQEHGKTHGARVNPGGEGVTLRFGEGAMLYDSATRQVAREIEFDVAVNAAEGTGTSGGVGIIVGPLALGTRGRSEASNTSTSRIRFAIPVMLPVA